MSREGMNLHLTSNVPHLEEKPHQPCYNSVTLAKKEIRKVVYPADRITSSSKQNIYCWMKSQTVNTTQMTMVMTNDLERKILCFPTISHQGLSSLQINKKNQLNLILFQVPAFNLFVITSRKHVGMPVADSKTQGQNCT